MCATSRGPRAGVDAADGLGRRRHHGAGVVPAGEDLDDRRTTCSPTPSRHGTFSTRSGRSPIRRWTSCSPRSRRSAAWSIRRSSSRTRIVNGAPRARHQCWYGIVGDDQFDEPWLDESFATWSSYSRSPHGRMPVHLAERTARLTGHMAYWDTHKSEYWVIYQQGGCMLANLANLFGLNRFRRSSTATPSRRLGIARTGDFLAAVEAAAAMDMPGPRRRRLLDPLARDPLTGAARPGARIRRSAGQLGRRRAKEVTRGCWSDGVGAGQDPAVLGCSQRELQTVARAVKEVNHPAGTEIAREGEPGIGLFVIPEGSATVSIGGRRRARSSPASSSVRSRCSTAARAPRP